MKYLKKITASILAAVLSISCATAVSAANTKAGDSNPEKSAKEPFDVLMIGDSNTEYGHITMGIKDIIDREYGNYGSGYVTIIGAVQGRLPEGMSFSYTGAWECYDMTDAVGRPDNLSYLAPDGFYARANTSGHSATVNFIGSAIDIFYVAAADAGKFSVTIDGNNMGIVDEQSQDFGTRKVSYDGLGQGSHSMTIRIVDTGRFANIIGVDARSGEKGTRSVLHKWGNASATTADFMNINPTVFDTALKAVDPDKVVILLGTNDHNIISLPAQNLKQNLIGLTNRVKSALPDAEVLICSTFETDTPNATTLLREYWNTSFPEAAEETGSLYWDMGSWFGSYDHEKMYDPWHVNPEYAKFIGEGIYNTLMGISVPKLGANKAKSVAELDDISVDMGVSFADLQKDVLPKTVDLITMSGESIPCAVTWSRGSYNASKAGSYRLIGTLAVPEGMQNAETLKARVLVTVGGGSNDPLVCGFSFEGMFGSDFKDLSNNQYHASAFSGAVLADGGKTGKALSLGGGNKAYAKLPDNLFTGMQEVTIASWINLRENRSWNRVFDLGNGTSSYITFSTNCENSYSVLQFMTPGKVNEMRRLPSIPLNTWTHVAFTIGSGKMTAYYNGEQVGQIGADLTPAALALTTQNYLGKSQYAPDDYMNGLIDDFVIYDKSLSGQEISGLMTDGLPETADLRVTMEDIDNLNGEIGTSFVLPVSLSEFPQDKAYKGIEAVVTLPDGVTVTDVVPSAAVSNATLKFYQEGNQLRFAFIAMEKASLQAESGKLVDIHCELSETQTPESVLPVLFDRFLLRDSDNALPYDITEATSNLTIAQSGLTALAQELYVSSGLDVIPAGKKAVSVSFTGLSDTSGVVYGTTDFYYNAQRSEKLGQTVYIALVDQSTSLEQLSDIANYTIAPDGRQTVLFGNTDEKDDKINAQDALNVVSVWLRRIEAPSDPMMLACNVSADGAIDTTDAIEILDYFLSGAEFSVVAK